MVTWFYIQFLGQFSKTVLMTTEPPLTAASSLLLSIALLCVSSAWQRDINSTFISTFRSCSTCLSYWLIMFSVCFCALQKLSLPTSGWDMCLISGKSSLLKFPKYQLGIYVAISLLSILREIVDRAALKKNCNYLSNLSLTLARLGEPFVIRMSSFPQVQTCLEDRICEIIRKYGLLIIYCVITHKDLFAF